MAQARPTAGGAANAGGVDYQNRVCAWFAIRVLAERAATPLWGLPASAALDSIRCETREAVDDILVTTSDGGQAFMQAKRTLSLSRKVTSEFAKAIKQFVEQYLAPRARPAQGQGIEGLNPERDRLVLVTSGAGSRTITQDLREALSGQREWPENIPLSGATRNRRQGRAIEVLLEHMERFWESQKGARPTDQEKRKFLHLVHVEVLDVEDGQGGEHAAIDLLGSPVLKTTGEATGAWRALVTLFATRSRRRTGADRIQLQQELAAVGFALHGTQSYKDDIKRLGEFSQQMATLLKRFSTIVIGQQEILVQREAFSVLRQRAEAGSLLVVGEPGAGKSAALYDFYQTMTTEGRDTILILADKLDAKDLGELRQHLGLENDIPTILWNWPGASPAFLVIDALDAARDDKTATVLKDLVQLLQAAGGRWRIVASIRKFDLRYGPRWQRLFAGKGDGEFCDNEFKGQHHLNIPAFSDTELAQILPQSALLHSVIANASDSLRSLLRLPFNVALAGELLGEGVTPADLRPIETQDQLLARFWRHRVIGEDGRGDARERLLRLACETMVHNRCLRVPRSVLQDTSDASTLNQLLSSHALVEHCERPCAPADRSWLGFSHHILFDYAVSVLLLRVQARELVELLAGEPELAMVVRPSLDLHFQHLWRVGAARATFWDTCIAVAQGRGVPEIGKVLGPGIGAQCARSIGDVECLGAALNDAAADRRVGAEAVLQHVIGSLVAFPPTNPPVVGEGAGPWCAMADRLSLNMVGLRPRLLRYFLFDICEHPDRLTQGQLCHVGAAARRLLAFVWSAEPKNKPLVIQGLRFVCRTFRSEPAAGSALLRHCIEPERLPEHGFEELPYLAMEIKHVLPYAPEFTEEVYNAAFGYDETSREPVALGDSQILALTSNRRQDYRGALWQLAETFPEFLRSAPLNAVRALAKAIESYVLQTHPLQQDDLCDEVFEFRRCRASVRRDCSAIWDDREVNVEDEPVKMLDALGKLIQAGAADHGDGAGLCALLDHLATYNKMAVLWKRLLELAVRYPSTLGMQVRELLWAKPILKGYDTTTAAGNLLRILHPLLTPADRERIEAAILSIPDDFGREQREWGERMRDSFLLRLPAESICTPVAASLAGSVRAEGTSPIDESIVSRVRARARKNDDVEYLEKLGVPMEDELKKRMLEMARPLHEFAEKHLNGTPTMEEAQAILPAFEDMRLALSTAERDQVDRSLQTHLMTKLLSAANCLARVDRLQEDDRLCGSVQSVLLLGSEHPEPSPDPERDGRSEQHMFWSPAPRIDAALGLMVLGRDRGMASVEVRQAIARLACDRVPAVRYQVVGNLRLLRQSAPNLMWEIAEEVTREEGHKAVLVALLTYVLRNVPETDAERVVTLASRVFERFALAADTRDVRVASFGLLVKWYVRLGHPVCEKTVHQVVQQPHERHDELQSMASSLRDVVTIGQISPQDPKMEAMRRRGIDLVN